MDDLSHAVVSNARPRRLAWAAAGALLILIHVLVLLLSFDFGPEAAPDHTSIFALTGLMLAGSAVFLVVAFLCRGESPNRGIFVWIVAVGIALRVIMIPSVPILEDDYFRYLWDGAVAAHGENPYRHAPAEIRPGAEDLPCSLRRLTPEAEPTLRHINHPHLRTIYPPAAQVVFAISYFIKPWSLIAWRLVLSVFDAAALVLLVLILRSLGLSPLWITVYWWNPLCVKEIVNSAHLDVIILPFVLATVWTAVLRKYLSAAFLLAIATGIKLWPLILLPVVCAPLLRSPRRLIAPMATYGILTGLIMLPVFLTGLGEDSGFTAYGKTWEMNDALYMLILWGVQSIIGLFSFAWNAQEAARVIVGAILGLWILWLFRRPSADAVETWDRALLTTAGLFLLSPTQFPWYYLWVIPFLAVRPRWSLLLLSALLPLYYLRFFFQAADKVNIFDYGIVWLEYVPVWALIILEWARGRAGRGVLGLPQRPSDR